MELKKITSIFFCLYGSGVGRILSGTDSVVSGVIKGAGGVAEGLLVGAESTTSGILKNVGGGLNS